MEYIDMMLRLIDGVTTPLRSIQQQVKDTAQYHQALGKNIERVGSSFTRMGKTMLPIATGITALGIAGGKAFVDFDAIITGAAAKAGATAEEMELMRQKASQFGADFPISATQAAEGMDRLAAAGYDANQVIGVMPSIITAAVASGEDLATTSDVVSNALNIWNMKQGDIAKNAAHVADVVQMAANKSSLGMNDFGVAMQYAGPPANTLNVSIEELSTAMAIMKNNGIEASTIGTSLRSMFSRLSEPPKPAAEAIATLGLQVKDAQGNFLGIQPVIEQLRGKLLNLSNTQQVAYAKAIAGEDAYSGLLSLIKTSPEAYQEMTDAMYNASGSSQAQFDIMKNTVKNAIDGMIGSFESLAISFGDALKPQIIAVLDMIGKFADTINAMPQGIKLFIADILAGTVAFTGLLFAVGKLISLRGTVIRVYGDIGKVANGGSISNKALESSVKGLSRAFNNLDGYINKLRATDGKIPIFKTIEDNFKTMRNLKWVDVGTTIAGSVSKNPIATVKTTVISNLKNLQVSTISASEALSRMYRNFYMSKAMESFAGSSAKVIKNLWGLTKASFAFAFSPLGVALIALAAAAYLVYTNWATFSYFFKGMWVSIQGAVASALGRIRPAIAQLNATLNMASNILRTTFISAFTRIQTVINNNSALFRILGNILRIVASVIGGTLLGVIIILANTFTGVLVFAIETAGAVISGFIGILNGIIQFITGVFTGNWSMAWEGVKNIFASIWDTIKGIAQATLDGILTTVNGIIDEINSIHIPEGVPGIGGMSLDLPHFPGNAVGNNNFAGGLTHINEKGGEIVDLPSGSRIYPHDRSLQMAYNQGQRSGSDSGVNINVNIYGASMNNDGDCERLAKKVVNIIVAEMSKRSINMNVGAV